MQALINTRRPQAPARRRGVTVVEMSLCAPLLFALVFGAVEFAQVNMIRNSAENAAYEGARAGIIPGATAASARAKAEEALTDVGIRGGVVAVTPSDLTDAQTVTVAISVPLSQNFWTVPKFFGDIHLTRSCTLQLERTGD